MVRGLRLVWMGVLFAVIFVGVNLGALAVWVEDSVRRIAGRKA